MLNTTKMKALLYGGLAFVAFLVAFLVCFFGVQMGWLYSISWGIFCGGMGAVLARTIFHIYIKDSSPEMWQVSIYGFVGGLAWLGCILCTSTTWFFVWLALLVSMILMLVGTRFLLKEIPFLKDKSSLDSLIATLEETRRYKFIDDDPFKGDDYEKPLCSVNNKPMTVVEAEAEGYHAIASSGRKYLRKIAKSMKKEGKNG